MRSAHWLHRLTELGPALVKHAFAPLMRFGTARTVGDPSAPRTLFGHIPRTAGDVIQTAVFAHLTWERSDIYSPIQCLGEAEMKALRQHRVAKGFVSHLDIAKLGDGLRLVTFLRNPVERVLSLHRFLRGGESERPWAFARRPRRPLPLYRPTSVSHMTSECVRGDVSVPPIDLVSTSRAFETYLDRHGCPYLL